MKWLAFEDLVPGASAQTPPCRVSRTALERFVAITRERFAIHLDDAFARSCGLPGCILPGKLVHAVAAARLQQVFGRLRNAAVLETTYDFLHPVAPDQPFIARIEVQSTEALGDGRGRVVTRRRILDARGRVLSLARVVEQVSPVRGSADAGSGS